MKIEIDKPREENDTILLQCRCRHFEFVQITKDEDSWYYFTISYYGNTVLEKLKAIWAIIVGARYSASEEVILYKQDIKKLIKFLESK